MKLRRDQRLSEIEKTGKEIEKCKIGFRGIHMLDLEGKGKQLSQEEWIGRKKNQKSHNSWVELEWEGEVMQELDWEGGREEFEEDQSEWDLS